MPKKKKEQTQDQIDRQDLLDYLSTIWVGEMNYGMVGSQLKSMMKDNPKYTYKGIKYTVWYAINHQDMQITSLGIVPYLYNEARDYYKWLSRIKKQLAVWQNEEKEIIIYKSKDREDEVIFD